MRWKEKPICQECQSRIEEDICIVMDDRDPFETCVCDRCRDKINVRLKDMPYIRDCIDDYLTELEQQTPVREYDLIEQPIFVY